MLFLLSNATATPEIYTFPYTTLFRSRDSNRFVAMGKRLSSCIDIRYAAAQAPQRASAYLIADDRAIVYRMRAESWDGVADINNQVMARLYLQEFDQVWNASEVERGLRTRTARRG